MAPSFQASLKSLSDLLSEGVEGRGVLVRSDLNVPLDDEGVITDPGRILASVPTLKALSDAGAKVVVTAHLGRPKDGPDPKFSLAPVAAALGAELGRHVQLAGDVVGSDALARAEGLTDGDVLMVENIRFDPRETSKDDAERLALAKELAELVSGADGSPGAFVSDGFGVVHRKQASVYDVATLLPHYAGTLVDTEVKVLEQLLAGVDHLRLQQRGADRNTLCGKEGEAHAAADDDAVGLGGQVLDDGQLVGDLRAAKHHRIWALRRAGELLEHLDLGVDQQSRVVREDRRDVVHRRLLAMHHAKSVGDERTGRTVGRADQFGQLRGPREPLGVVLAGLTGVEANVLDHQHVTVGQAFGARERIGADDVASQLDVPAQFRTEGSRDGRQRELGVGSVLRPPEVSGDDDLGSGIRQRLQRRDGGEDATGIGDRPLVVERNVQVGAHQYAPTLDPLGKQIRQ